MTVYKSEEGRALVEGYYRRLLASDWPAPFKQRFVRTSAGQTHLLEFGDGSKPPLLMLHGSMSNSATWLGCAGDFLGSFSVFCADIPGEPGLSDPLRMSLGAGEAAAWLSSLLDALGFDEAAFAGMSLGGYYALSFASVHPERVRALALITAAGIAPQRKDFMFKVILCMMLGKYGTERMNRLIYHKAQVDSRALEFQALVQANFNPVMEKIPLLADDELKRLTMPLLYLGGDHDALLDTERSAARLRTLVPHADIRVLADTGHAIIDQFAAVRDFLAKAARDRASYR
jgi:pimeloyl-ACP methyl ester carboxylesterase